MSDQPADEAYLEAHLAEALARDPRVGELGLEVIVSGDSVTVRGAVSTTERSGAIDEVLRALAPGRRIHNHTTSGPASIEVGEPEAIS